MKTSAVLVNHNSNGTILKAIQSLSEQDYPLDSIIVVDNHSADGGPQQIRAVFPGVQVIELGENRGLSYARNVGLAMTGSNLVLLMDDDVYLTRGALQIMVKALQETGASIICPRIVLYPETDTIQCDGAAIHVTATLVLRHAHEPVSTHSPERVFTNGFIGACLLVDRKTLEQLGFFDEEYFFYFEDLELSYRLRGMGHVICCEENAIAHHERGEGTENLSFRGSGPYPGRRAYYNLRNRWLTALLHIQTRTAIILLPAIMLYEAAAFGESVRRGWAGSYFRALLSVLQIRSSILKRRHRWQSARKLMDRDILSGGDLPLARGFAVQADAMPLRLLNCLLNAYWNWAIRWL